MVAFFSCLLRIEHDAFLHLHGSFWLNFPYTRRVCGRDSHVERCLSVEDDVDDDVGGEQHDLCLFLMDYCLLFDPTSLLYYILHRQDEDYGGRKDGDA